MSTQDPVSGYAYWIPPDGSTKVVYSLPVFHEIDSLVNDGYRRIPHGGIEIAGLLFGTVAENMLRIGAFRLIECQHAFGPSFVLSERDLSQLREQLTAAQSDPELEGFQALGCFIGHTRSPLRMSDREVVWFDEFFPGQKKMVVLVKPEHFQPTQFGFLLRDKHGQIERDASGGAVILPLPGRAERSGDEVSESIPAPQAARTRVDVQTPEQAAPRQAVGESTRVRTPAPAGAETNPFSPVKARTINPEPTRESPATRQTSFEGDNAPPLLPQELPGRQRRLDERESGRGGLGWRFAAVLLMAAAFGCVAGYLAYLQLPSPVIALTAHEQQNRLVILWPAAQTSGVDYAAIKVNDGDTRTLSSDEKAAGQAVITAPPGNVKVELVARHWLRNARGILRLVRKTASDVPAAKPAITQVPYR